MPRRNKNGARNKQRRSEHAKAESQKGIDEGRSKKKKRRSASNKAAQAGASRGRSQREDSQGQAKGDQSSTKMIGLKMVGKLELHPKGFGFFIPDDPKLPNVYIAEEELRDCLNRDRVVIQISEHYRGEDKYRGKVVSIEKRGQSDMLGSIRLFKGGALFVPTDGRDRRHVFSVSLEDLDKFSLGNGSHALARIEEYPSKSKGKVRILEEVQQIDSASSDTLRILVEGGWPREFSQAAIKSAEAAENDWLKRLPKETYDLQRLPFVTIDGEDARDFDDAVYAEKMDNGKHKIWVAIADVSFFVKPGTALDQEAFERSTSVYFPDFVVPMLPENLSNGVCSLNPNTPRAALVCEFVVTANGKIESYKFFEGLIQSHKRMTYELMQSFIDQEAFALEELKPLERHLSALVDVYKILRKAKTQRGAIDMDIPEARVFLEKNGEVRDIQPRMRLEAHRLIEELMLAANECTSRYLEEHKLREGMYRIHEQPDENRVKDLIAFITLIGLPFEGSLETAKDFSHFLEGIRPLLEEEDPKAMAVQNMVLRSMQQARYSNAPLGHFALANPHYTHFTSPIRRYPDLIVHRLIKEHLNIEEPLAPPDAEMESTARHCSEHERMAMDMERKLIDIKKCRYMEKHLGEDFKAVVTGVIEKGIFCQIEDHFVDGLIKGDLLHKRMRLNYDAGTMCFKSHSGQRLQLGDRVVVKVIAVDPMNAKIDFDLVVEE
ncbi:ribonuclease R [bacterium]|nr:ribonuclease R [bacterium]